MSQAKKIKRLLNKSIKSVRKHRAKFVVDPSRDFTRTGKLPLDKSIKTVLSFTSKSLNGEMVDIYGSKPDMPTASALFQRRARIKPSAFEHVFRTFTSQLPAPNTLDGLRLLACDGSDLRTILNPDDTDSYFENGDKEGYNLFHLNALFDLNNNIYVDALVQKRHNLNETDALHKMIDASDDSDPNVYTCDRNYECYNTMAHIQEKSQFFLIRGKDILSSGIAKAFDLPDSPEFDVQIEVKLTRRRTKETLELFKDKNHYHCISPTSPFDFLPATSKKNDPVTFYTLRFRIVRFKIKDEKGKDSYEVILTNLDSEKFPPARLKELYAMRWGIETSFRSLKYSMGLLHFHSKKPDFILQEIYANLTMYNFTASIALGVKIDKPKEKYRINFSVAAGICRKLFLGSCTPEIAEKNIRRHILPIRKDVHKTRDRIISKPPVSFNYRIS